MPAADSSRCHGVLMADFVQRHGVPASRARAMAAPLDLRGPYRMQGAWSFLVRNVTAGVFNGDRYEIDLRARTSVCCAVRGTAATNVHGSLSTRPAETTLRLTAEPGSTLAYLEAPLILQAGARLSQSVEIVRAGGTVIYSEVVALGRLARDECGRFSRFASRLRILSPDGEPLFSQRSVLTPGATGNADLMAATGAIAGRLVVAGDVDPAMWDALCAERPSQVLAGWDVLPNDAGSILCVIGTSLEPVSDLLAEAARTARLRPGAQK